MRSTRIPDLIITNDKRKLIHYHQFKQSPSPINSIYSYEQRERADWGINLWKKGHGGFVVGNGASNGDEFAFLDVLFEGDGLLDGGEGAGATGGGHGDYSVNSGEGVKMMEG